jgi:hypothetical protein
VSMASMIEESVPTSTSMQSKFSWETTSVKRYEFSGG